MIAADIQPIQNLIKKLLRERDNIFCQILNRILTCGMCVGFWGGMILTVDFKQACLISFLTEFLYKKTFFN